MTEPAFNLSAEISLQLAKGAAASLKREIEKGFSTKVEIDPSTLAADLNKATRAAKKAAKPIEVPITFKLADRVKQDAAVKRAIGKIAVEVELSKTSISANITSAKLKELMGARTLKSKVEVIFDQKGAKKFKELEKFIKQTTKEYEKLKDEMGVIDDIKVDTTGVKALGKEASESSERLKELIGRISNLAKSTSKQFSGGKFFKESNSEIRNLLSEMDKLTKGKGFELLEKKFRGLNNNSAGNLESSLKTIFKAYNDLETQSKKLDAAQAKSPRKNFGVERKALDDARAAVGKLFRELDAADPQSFAILVTSAMREVAQVTKSALINAERDIQRFDALLSNLAQKKAGIDAGAGRGVTKSTVDNLINYVKSRQQLFGETKEQVIASPKFQELNALLGELKYVDQAAQRASSSLDALLYKSKTTGLGDTLGGRNTGYTKKVADITARAQGEIDGSTVGKKNQEFKDKATQDIANLTTRAEKLNGVFSKIFEKYSQFKADGFKNAASAVRKLGFEIYRLAQSGESLESLNRSTTIGLSQINALKALDAKVNTSIKQIDRLRAALEFSPTEDIAGAKPALDNLQRNLEGRKGQFTGLTEGSLNQGLSKGFFDIRGMQKFNEAANTTVAKMQNISDAAENLTTVDVYKGFIDKFQDGARKIAKSSDDVGTKLQRLKQLADSTLIGAKLGADGGLFGSIAKAAGLAAKRLGAFLVLAQGMYSIQSALSSAFSEAVKVDKEFVRLEQVFNKDFTGSKLEQGLKSITAQIKGLGKTLGVSTLEVANAAQILAQAGIYGRDLAALLDTISKSQLGPSFGNASETAEATIAILRQFNLTAKGVQEALGGINRLSAKYAVEAKGITEAVRRAGGVFSATGNDIGSFAAAFTLVKQKTREADEAIATGLRNIAQRIQSSDTQEKLKAALGIDLVENGEFIGFEEAISKIGKALKEVGATGTSPLFAQVREIVGGRRQGARVAPLLEDYEGFNKLKEEFRKGAKSIDEDVSVAFQSIENKLERAKAAAVDLFHEIISSDFVKFLVEGFTQITLVVTSLLKALNSVPGAILAIGAVVKTIGAGKIIGQALLSQFAARVPLPFTRNKGGPIGFNRGSRGGTGLIPGGGPNKDSLLAYLTTGEYVLQRKAVKKYGTTFLDNLNDGTITANKGGPIRRNSGGIIPGFNTGGLNNISGASSLFTGFVSFIKKVIGLGGAIEKTTQEIQTGLNLPELFDRAIKPRSEPINTDIISILRDQAKENIEAIKKTGAFVEGSGTSGDKFLPKPGTPELPSSIMDGIIKDALKTPAKNRLPVQPYKGNANELRNLSKEAGIDIPKKLFTQLFKGVKVIGKGEAGLKEGSAASFNKRTKQATFTDQSIFNPKVVAHEIGHGLETIITGKLKGVANALQKSGTGARTRERLINSGIYGEENSPEFNKKLNSETLADIFKEATALKSGKGGNFSEKDKGLLNLFSNVLKKQTGISITGRSKSNDSAIRLSGVLDNLKQTDNQRALGPIRLPGSFNKPLNPVSQSIIDNRNNEAVRDSSSSGNFQSIIQAIRKQGAFKGGVAGSVVGGGASLIGKGSPASTVFKSSALPQGGLLAFGKSLVSTKTGMLGLATSVFALSAVFGGAESGLSKLVIAMASAAASMYAISQTASLVGFAKNAAGVGAKNLKISKAKSIAESFAASNPKKGISAASRQLSLDNSILPGAIDSSKARRAAQSIGGFKSAERTSSVLANIRGSAPAAGSIVKAAKSPLAAANLAAANQSGILGKSLTKFSGGMKGLSGKFTYGAIVAGLVVGALNFFTDSLVEAGKAGKESAKNLDDVKSAGAKGRLGEVLSSVTPAVGSTVTGAATGAAIGSFVPIIGTAVGGVVGGIAGFLFSFKDDLLESFSTTFPLISAFGENISTGISNLFGGISDSIYVAYQNLSVGSFTDKLKQIGSTLSNFSVVGLGKAIYNKATGKEPEEDNSYGARKLRTEKQKDVLDFNVKKIGEDFTNPAYGKKQNKLNANQAQDLTVKGLAAAGTLSKFKESIPGGNFADATKNKTGSALRRAEKGQDEIKKEFEDIAAVYKVASSDNKKLIIDNYKKQGIDIVELSKEVGVVLDDAGSEMTRAFDELSIFFTKMRSVTELSSARISGLEGALQNFSDPSKISSDLPDQYFDILKQGIDPASLGFGNTFTGGVDKARGLAQGLDPRLLENADFEVKGRRAARDASRAVIAGAPELKTTTDTAVGNFITGAFLKASGGQQDDNLNTQFQKFVESKGTEATSELVDSKTGKVNGQKVDDLFKEFADSLENGSLEEIKRLNNLSKQYVDQYKSHIAARFALENEANNLLKGNVDKRKALADVQNRSQGLTGDKLAAAQGRQAATSDSERLGLTLQGTGFGAGSSVNQLGAGLLASQQRQRNAAATAQAGGGTQGEKDSRRAEIEAGEVEQQNRLRAALELVASGTDSAAYNMAEFERALEKAASSSKFMTDALLGSDDQMNQTILGIQAFAKVQEAFKQGGVGAAQQTLSTFSEDARQALGSYVGQNADNAAAFNQATGISSNITAGTEAGNVAADSANQIAATNALVAGLQDNATNMQTNTEKMKEIYESQFKNTAAIVASAEATTKALVDQISSLPDVYHHEGNVKVTIEGAAGLETLQKGMKEFVENLINTRIEEYTNKLVQNNNGINRP